MKAKPVITVDGSMVLCDPAEATHILIKIPGPSSLIHLPVQIKGTRAGTGNWSWNGDIERPTIKPSLLSKMGPDGGIICHTWITDGRAQFLADSTHELAGQTLDLMDVE